MNILEKNKKNNKSTSNKEKEQLIINSKALYLNSDNLVLKNKNFVLIIIDILKEIVSKINKSLTNNKDNNINTSSINNSINNNINNNINKNNIIPIRRKSVTNLGMNTLNSKAKTQRLIKADKLNRGRQNDLNELKLEIDKYNIKELISMYEKYIEFDDISKKYLNNDNLNLDIYIQKKKMIDYCNENENLKKLLNIENIKEKLLNNFIHINKNTENNFNDLIINNNIPNKFNYFNYFSDLSPKIIDNIKLLINFLNKNENNIDLIQILNKYNASPKIKKIKKIKSIRSIKSIKSLRNFKNDKNKQLNMVNNNNSSYNNYNEDNTSLKLDEYERDDSSIDTEMTQKEKKIKVKKVDSVGKKIADRLYKPFIEKTYFIRKLKQNMNEIKDETLKFSKTLFAISKKKKEEKIISDQMLIYNNPNLNVNDLSSNIYNDLNSLIIKTKRIQSMSNIKRKMLKKNK